MNNKIFFMIYKIKKIHKTPFKQYPKHQMRIYATVTKKASVKPKLYVGSARAVKPAIKADVFLSHREELLAKQCQARLLSEKLIGAKIKQ